MSVINTNVKSLVAQNAINGNNKQLSTAMQRLSTGLRVNSAADDAAGLSIGTRMTAQVRGLNMAIKNANDGISLLNTAEGAMDEVTNMLQRMRELSVQAATDTVSASDRQSLNKEVVALQKEINRVAQTTQFNGFNILDGSFSNKQLQIGDKAGVTMDVSLKSVESAALGSQNLAKGTVVSARVDAASLSGDQIFINGTAIDNVDGNNSDPLSAVTDLKDLVAAVNNSNVGVTATSYNELAARYKGSGVSAAGDVIINVTALDTGNTTDITLGATTSLQDMVDQINAQGGASTVMARLSDEGKLVLYNDSGATITTTDGSTSIDVDGFGITATGIDDGDYNGFLKLTSNSGQPFKMEFQTPADADVLGLNQINADGTVVASAALDASGFDKSVWLSGSMLINGVDIWYKDLDITGANANSPAGSIDPQDEFVKAVNHFTDKTGVTAGLTVDGRLTLKSLDNSPIQIRLSEDFRQVTGANKDQLSLMEQNVGASDFNETPSSLGYFAGGSSVASANVLTKETASAAIKVMDSALDQVSMYRSDIGASVNRLDSTVSNLSNVVTNAQASRSRIMDTDYATETTNLARSQIIQQAATAMLAQANQSAQTVLSLLK